MLPVLVEHLVFREKKKDDGREVERCDKEARERRHKMDITPAERITHQVAAQAVASLFAFAALTWNIWSFQEKKKGR